MDNLSRDIVVERLTKVFQYVFDEESIELFDEMTANDIDEWDSLMHITLIVAVEKEFGLKLNASEMGKLKNVGSMIDILKLRGTK